MAEVGSVESSSAWCALSEAASVHDRLPLSPPLRSNLTAVSIRIPPLSRPRRPSGPCCQLAIGRPELQSDGGTFRRIFVHLVRADRGRVRAQSPAALDASWQQWHAHSTAFGSDCILGVAAPAVCAAPCDLRGPLCTSGSLPRCSMRPSCVSECCARPSRPVSKLHPTIPMPSPCPWSTASAPDRAHGTARRLPSEGADFTVIDGACCRLCVRVLCAHRGRVRTRSLTTFHASWQRSHGPFHAHSIAVAPRIGPSWPAPMTPRRAPTTPNSLRWRFVPSALRPPGMHPHRGRIRTRSAANFTPREVRLTALSTLIPVRRSRPRDRRSLLSDADYFGLTPVSLLGYYPICFSLFSLDFLLSLTVSAYFLFPLWCASVGRMRTVVR